MKHFKKIKSLLAASLSIAMLSGCTTAPTSSQSGSGTQSSQTALGMELLLGAIGPLSGNYANYGISVKNGAEIAVSEINAAGGVNGITFKLDFQDSQGDPESAVNAYGKLLDSGMNVSLGTVLSGECASVVTAAAEDDIFILSPTASAVDALKGNDKAFRVCFSDTSQGIAAADYITQKNLAKKVAVFYASDNDYSVGLYNSFKAQAEKNGIQIVSTQTFTDSTKTDFSTQIAAIASSDAELVFIPIYAAEAATFLEQAQGKLTGKTFFGCDGLDGILGKISDSAKAEGLMLLTPFAADDPDEKVAAFVKSYKEKYNSTPDQFAADGYDAVYVIAQALKEANVTVDDNNNLTSRLVDAIKKITFKGTTGEMTWTADGEAVKQAKVMVIKNGVAVLHDM